MVWCFTLTRALKQLRRNSLFYSILAHLYFVIFQSFSSKNLLPVLHSSKVFLILLLLLLLLLLFFFLLLLLLLLLLFLLLLLTKASIEFYTRIACTRKYSYFKAKRGSNFHWLFWKHDAGVVSGNKSGRWHFSKYFVRAVMYNTPFQYISNPMEINKYGGWRK